MIEEQENEMLAGFCSIELLLMMKCRSRMPHGWRANANSSPRETEQWDRAEAASASSEDSGSIDTRNENELNA